MSQSVTAARPHGRISRIGRIGGRIGASLLRRRLPLLRRRLSLRAREFCFSLCHGLLMLYASVAGVCQHFTFNCCASNGLIPLVCRGIAPRLQ